MPHARSASRVASIALTLLAACGGVVAPGASPTATADAGANIDAGSNADAASVANPMRLASGNRILGITSDDFVVYYGDLSQQIFAVSASGGAPVAVADGSIYEPVVIGRYVFFGPVSGEAAGPVRSWRSDGTISTIATLGCLTDLQASSDGSLVSLIDPIDAATNTGPLVLEHADGSSRVVAADGVKSRVTKAATPPGWSFGGANAFLAWLDASGGALDTAFLAPSETSVTLFHGAAGGPTPTSSTMLPDPTGAHVLLVTSAGLVAFAADGSSQVVIAPDTDVNAFYFAPDGTTVLYTTRTATALKRTSLAGGTPTLLASSGFDPQHDYALLSPDGAWMLGQTSIPGGGASTSLVSTALAGAPHATRDVTVPGNVQYTFTADSLNVIATDPLSGALVAFATGTPGPAVTIVPGAAGVRPTTGSQVLYVKDSPTPTSTSGLLDLYVVDVTNPSVQTLVAFGAGAPPVVTHDARHAVYVGPTDDPNDALWVVPLP